MSPFNRDNVARYNANAQPLKEDLCAVLLAAIEQLGISNGEAARRSGIQRERISYIRRNINPELTCEKVLLGLQNLGCEVRISVSGPGGDIVPIVVELL